MQSKASIGVFIPPQSPGRHIDSGSSLMPQDVRTELLALLRTDPRIGTVHECDFSKLHVVDGKVYQGDLCLSDLDLVFWSFVTETAESWSAVMLRTLAQHTVVVPNPHAASIGLDKYQSHMALKNAGVKVADFFLLPAQQVQAQAADICAQGAVLLKPRFGSFGHGIHKVSNARDLIDAVQYAQSFSAQPLQVFGERFVENDMSRWISATVVGGDVVYGYRKNPEKFADWKVYDAERQGGGVSFVDATPVAAMALKAAGAIGDDLIGFDFIYDTAKGEYVIVDENTFPGLYPDCFTQSGKGSWGENFARMILRRLP